jgi:multiple sugar transport system permease protein
MRARAPWSTWWTVERAWRVVARAIGRVSLYLIIFAGALVFFLPFAWMLSTSVKPGYQVYVTPPVWIPDEFQWRHWIEPWEDLPFLRFYRNTATIVLANMIGVLVSCSLVAFGFARIDFRGRNAAFLVLLSTMMLPRHVTLIPTYVLFSKLGWIDTFLPLIVRTYMAPAYNVFLLRQFMMTVSPELDDAARIDGCSTFGIYRRIMLPLCKPALGVVAINCFTYNWNDFMGPLIYLDSMTNFTISLGLRMFESRDNVDLQATMAMTIVSMIPVLAVFFIAQRYFIQGIVLTGVKG